MGILKTKKLWIALIALVAALAMSFTLVGCGGESDEELITKAIDEEMSIIVEPDDETIQMLADEATSGAGSTFETMGIDSAELVKSWIDGFGYTIGEITVDGDYAYAGQTIMEEINGASPIETAVTVELTKDGNNWVFDQSSANQTALMDAMIGDYSF